MPIESNSENPMELGQSARERLIAQAVADYLDLQSQEEAVDLEVFCREHEDLLPELRTELATIEQIGNALEPAASPPLALGEHDGAPDRLSNHRILSEIGSGGMGRVFLAADEGLGRKVAIKALSRRYRDNAVLKARFMQESRSMARISHPNVARIYSLGPPDEIPHFVMEYLEGAPLTEAARPLGLRQKIELFHKVILAVDFLYRHQVIHRDLKPANILVGSDLEPKILDFGLAMDLHDRATRLTHPGEIMGTPDYFSPEQAASDKPLDARSDVFSLGVIFYEMLTGELPFRGEDLADQVRRIREVDAILPRRIKPDTPGELQNTCLKALEKNPRDRYGSAQKMADDLERYLAGEPVLASPSSYSRITAQKAADHLRELEGWNRDKILSDSELDGFRKAYGRLVDREDAWIMEARRLTLPQVSLYLGAWIIIVGAALISLLDFDSLKGTPAVLSLGTATVPSGYVGIKCWKLGQRRISIAYLLAFCLLLPIWLLVTMYQYHLFSAFTGNDPALELFAKQKAFETITNTQLWWSILLSLPAYYGLRRLTGNSVYSLVFAVMATLLGFVTLLRRGLLGVLDPDPGRLYMELIKFGIVFLLAGFFLERRRLTYDSRYFYFLAVIFTVVSLSGVAALHEPYANWLREVLPRTRGQLEYLFIINAGIYFALQHFLDRFRTAQLRNVAKVFRFVIPGHIMTSLAGLAISAYALWQDNKGNLALKHETRFFEILLPVVACSFVFGSIPKQMKNYFASGLFFLAVGVVFIEFDIYEGSARWPLSLLIIGIVLMYVATNYASIRMSLFKLLRREGHRS